MRASLCLPQRAAFPFPFPPSPIFSFPFTAEHSFALRYKISASRKRPFSFLRDQKSIPFYYGSPECRLTVCEENGSPSESRDRCHAERISSSTFSLGARIGSPGTPPSISPGHLHASHTERRRRTHS